MSVCQKVILIKDLRVSGVAFEHPYHQPLVQIWFWFCFIFCRFFCCNLSMRRAECYSIKRSERRFQWLMKHGLVGGKNFFVGVEQMNLGAGLLGSTVSEQCSLFFCFRRSNCRLPNDQTKHWIEEKNQLIFQFRWNFLNSLGNIKKWGNQITNCMLFVQLEVL